MAQNILVSSLDRIPNYTITETMGVVYYSFQTHSNYNFENGLNNLRKNAQSKGCNAIINVKWTCTTTSSNYLYYSIFGEAVKLVKSQDEKDLSEKGLKKESIEILIEKGKCSREQAIKALKECNGDITEASLAIDLNKNK